MKSIRCLGVLFTSFSEAVALNGQAPLVPDPTQLPSTLITSPATSAYNALNVPNMPAGGTYADPVTGVTIVKLTSKRRR